MLHILGATIWTGGHLVLCLGVLPGALREKRLDGIQLFESKFEKIGIPALILQVITGFYLMSVYLPSHAALFSFDTFHAKCIAIKLLLLVGTLMLGVHARLKIIPGLSVETLPRLAGHIIAITILSVLFVIMGVAVRVGGFP